MKKNSLLSMAFVLYAVTTFSQESTFNNLWGMKAAYLDTELNKSGYYHIKTEKSGYDSYTYWWNSSKNKCISARTNNGVVASIVNTSAFDCNKSNDNSHYERPTYNHSGHHSNYDPRHNEDQSLKMAFDRGFTDGLHNKPYHNPYQDASSKFPEYAKGYGKGVNQRADNTSYHSGRGGNHAHVTVTDLRGQNAEMAYNELNTRGFAEQRKHTSGDKTYRVFYNANTQQCIKTTSIDKRIVEIQNSTNCD